MWTVIAALFLLVSLTGIGDLGFRSALAASTDHTSSNVGKTPTASDQGGNEAERRITQQIRRAVVEDDSLSVNAHNVTIVTQGSKVTLRGSVKSDSEKTKIADKAKKVSGVKSVANLLTVEK